MTDKKSIMFDIDDPRSGKVAEALGNKTSKRILGLLSDREMSESDIASELGLPANTVNYNIKKLVDAGLIVKSKRVFWSSKGKKMELYSVSNRRIIISPRRLSAIVPVLLGVLVIVLAIVIVLNIQGKVDVPGEVYILDDNNLKTFNSYSELKEFVEESGGYDYRVKSFGEGGVATDSVAGVVSESAGASLQAKSSADEFSGTNVQVQGVDEPDIVKNDGEYIYSVVGKKIVIVDAFPP